MNSFLPSTINAWNSLPQATRETDSVLFLKRLLNIEKPIPNCKLYKLILEITAAIKNNIYFGKTL